MKRNTNPRTPVHHSRHQRPPLQEAQERKNQQSRIIIKMIIGTLALTIIKLKHRFHLVY